MNADPVGGSRQRFIDPNLHRITNHASVRSFVRAAEVPPGYNIIQEGGLPIDLQINDRGHDATIVSLHGAVTKGFRLPYMAGQGVTRGLNANRIFVSDPSLMLDNSLNLAWFAGSSRQRTQSALCAILERIIAARPEVKRWVFFGSSGGGFASLFFASRFPGSYAVVSNPQTAIPKYVPEAVAEYARIAFGLEGSNSIARIPVDVVDDLVQVYSKPVDTTVFYAQNSADTFHLANHAKPFFDVLHAENRVWWLRGDDWGDGHTAPPKSVFEAMLAAAIAEDPIGEAEKMSFVRARSTLDIGLN